MAANALMPGAGGVAAPPEATPNPLVAPAKPVKAKSSQMMQHFQSAEASAKKQYDKMKEAEAQMTVVKDQFEHLTTLMDTVKSDDVVRASAEIVAAGVPALQMATILADMPEQGPGLQAWVQHEYQQAIAAEGKVEQALAISRHQMATTGIRSLIAHSVESREQQQQMAGPPAGNA